jgi:flagellar hook-associated protein 1 FlgK
MGNGIYGISVTALGAAQAGLVTTQHNIANARTAGFHRQQIVQSAAIPNLTGFGFLGQGVQVDTVKRIYSEFLDKQVTAAQTQASQWDSYNAQISQIDNMLADANSGLSPALQNFFNGVQDVASNPASVPSRQAMLSGAQSLAARFQALNQRFEEIRSGVNSQVGGSVGAINSYARQIADLNQKIGLAQGSAGAQQAPNDLLDQRDNVIAEMNQIIKVSTVKQDDGSINIFIGNGQTLVLGAQSFTLAASPSPEDPERMDVGVSYGGSTILLPKGSLQGGTLGGLLAFRDETLDPAQNALGRAAIGLAQTFNDQHRLGMDLNGALGGDFFNVSSAKVIGNTSNPAGAGVAATINNAGALTTSDYRLSYNGSAWSLFNVMTNQAVAMAGAGTAASPFVADGLSFVVTPPTVATNTASFLIKPTVNGARDFAVKLTDTAKVAAAAPIRTSAALANTGSGAISAGAVNSFNDKVTLTFTSPTAFDVVDNTTGATLAKNVAYASGGNISFNGWTAQITDGGGAPVAGDKFVIDHALTSTTSTTATIGTATLNSPSPVDPMLKNAVNVVFDSATTFHLEGATNNITGASTIVGGAVAPTQGKTDGSLAAGLTITLGVDDQLAVTVDGVTSTVTLTAGVYGTAALLAAQVQADINADPTIFAAGKAVTVTEAAGALTITSNSYGAASSVSATGGNGLANLLGTPVSTAGLNPVGTASSGAATVGTGGSGAYAATGVKTTISGGTVTGTGPFTLTGATLTVEGGSYVGSTTFSGITISITAAGDISIPAVSGSAVASTFNARPATGLSFTAGGTTLVSANGWTVQLGGTPQAGDVFSVGANSSGVSDNRNVLLLQELQTKNTLAGGTATYQGVYSQLVSQVGNKAREVHVAAQAQTNLVAQTTQAAEALSGVNLDEEAANLIRYQQAYQAAGKAMQIATTLFDTLLAIGN